MIYFMKRIYKSEDKIVQSLIKDNADLGHMYKDYRRVISNPDLIHYFQSLEKKETDEFNRLYHAKNRGLAKGLAKGKAEVVHSIHAEGFAIDTIACITKLSTAEVQQILANQA